MLAADYPFLDLMWTMAILFLWILWIWLLFSVFADIFRRHDLSVWGKTAWILFVILLPFLGVFVYLITQNVGMTERKLQRSLTEQSIGILSDGDIGLLDNVRFWPGEEANDPEFARGIAAHGDFYVNDAFSAAHRAHASTEGLAHHLPAFAGRAMEAELKALDAALGNPEQPVAAVVGGAKVSTKLDVLENLVGKVRHLIIG